MSVNHSVLSPIANTTTTASPVKPGKQCKRPCGNSVINCLSIFALSLSLSLSLSAGNTFTKRNHFNETATQQLSSIFNSLHFLPYFHFLETNIYWAVLLYFMRIVQIYLDTCPSYLQIKTQPQLCFPHFTRPTNLLRGHITQPGATELNQFGLNFLFPSSLSPAPCLFYDGQHVTHMITNQLSNSAHLLHIFYSSASFPQ